MSPLSKVCLILFCCLGLQVSAQTKAELEKKRDQLNDQMKVTNQLLEENQNNKNQLQTAVSLLNRKISLRQQLIQNRQTELALIDRGISNHEDSIAILKQQVQNLRNDYAEMIRQAQRNRSSYDRLMYIFASTNFYQALRRLHYMQELAKSRERKAQELVDKQKLLSKKIAQLKDEKDEKEKVVAKQKSEVQDLASDKSQQVENLGDLKKKERQLKQQLSKQEQEQAKLNDAIQKIIAEEIKMAKKKSSTGTFDLTPEARALSKGFENNKGKLPWPVERGVVTSSFGKHPHPVLKGIIISNNGIDISTAPGSDVRAIYSGVVTSVFNIPGAGMNVIISHGAYRSVYANLQKVFVKKGDHVSTKQTIGTVLTNDATGKTEAHLEIWKISNNGTNKQNPELWLFTK